MAFRFCKHAKLYVMDDGKQKVKCKLDGHIVNQCKESCPHLRLTFRAKRRVCRWRKNTKWRD